MAKVNAAGTALVYSGYIAGTGEDYAYGVEVDGSGNAYVTGQTSSGDFPVTVGPDLTINGTPDAYVLEVDAAGATLVYCGYIGGSQNDGGQDIAVDGSGNAYVIGTTNSTPAQSFPVTVGPDLIHNGGNDAFVAKVTATATALYRSVGPGNTTDLNTSTRTVAISGTTATFSGSMPDKVGVGDVLKYLGAVAFMVGVTPATSEGLMAQVLVRGLTPEVLSRLKARAKTRGHTLQTELKEILEHASLEGTLDARAVTLRIRRVLGKDRSQGLRPGLSLPLEQRKKLFPVLAAELGRLLRKGRTSERGLLRDFESWRKKRRTGCRHA